ncbi:MAG: TIM barrel protein [Planctomycetales bacterium]|nr:TIM barrel protein [Planctomycetales bacterium]
MSNHSDSQLTDRRHLLKSTAFTAAATAAGVAATMTPQPLARAEETRKRNGRVRQSIVHWCYGSSPEKWSVEKTCQVGRELGYQSVELVSFDAFPTLKKYDMTCAIVGARINPGPGFMRGFNNPNFHPMVIAATKEAIEAAAANGFPNVIAFTGFSAIDPANPAGPQLSLAEGADNCVRGFKEVMALAEAKGVNVCLEMLNSRDGSGAMLGHPGYQGDHTDYCAEIIRRVGSPRMKLLFDIYHVQIMDGDVIRRIRQHHEIIGHVHTAGNPGRGELDAKQEINYPAVIQALVDVGYQGFVGQEFIPTRDVYTGLKEAFEICDV